MRRNRSKARTARHAPEIENLAAALLSREQKGAGVARNRNPFSAPHVTMFVLLSIDPANTGFSCFTMKEI